MPAVSSLRQWPFLGSTRVLAASSRVCRSGQLFSAMGRRPGFPRISPNTVFRDAPAAAGSCRTRTRALPRIPLLLTRRAKGATRLVTGNSIKFVEALVPSACRFRWALDTSAPTTRPAGRGDFFLFAQRRVTITASGAAAKLIPFALRRVRGRF
jgi:hypothetical protein